MEQFNFQVNLEGIIDILSNHLYSEERVFVRELLQNAADAIHARQRLEPSLKGEISVEVLEEVEGMPPQVVFEDNGIGLTEEEVHAFLSNIGASSKREDLLAQRNDFIGQFGIGLLSCFIVTAEIVMITRSAKGGDAIEWHGYNDGSYSVRKLKGEFSSGTKIFLRSKAGMEQFFTWEQLRDNLQHFGDMLPHRIELRDGGEHRQVNRGKAPWEVNYPDKEAERDALLTFGKSAFETDFHDYIPISTQDGSTSGIAYILPYETNPSARSAHKVYLKNMLVADSVNNLLPEWAFFVKCVVNTQTLRPTASRESFYEDAALRSAKAELGKALKAYLIGLASENPDQLRALYLIHHHTMSTLALHDNEFFRIIIHYIPFETTVGKLTLDEIEQKTNHVRHVPNVDEFRQIAGIATAQDILVINSGYTYKQDLLERYGALYPHIQISSVTTDDFIRQFDDLETLESEKMQRFLSIAEDVLREYKCMVTIKKFKPTSLTALYSKDEGTSFWQQSEQGVDDDDTLWGGIFKELANQQSFSYAQFCYNYQNRLVRKMASLQDEEKMRLYIKISYVQALLLGHHALQANELNILGEGLISLMNSSLD